MGGELTVDKYLMLLKYQLEHDQKLIKYFESKKEMDKVKLVAERIPMILGEMDECISYAKTQKR